MQVLETHIVPKGIKKSFLNLYAPTVFKTILTKTKAKKAIARGEIRINKKQVSTEYMISPGDTIELVVTREKKKVYAFDLPVVYEDQHLAIVNKPGGIPVNGNTFKTVENALPHNLKPSKAKDALPHPLPVHRLDSPTCGLVLVAKTATAQLKLGKAFQKKDIDKTYYAVVVGKVENLTKVDTPIDNKPSLTYIRTIAVSRSLEYRNLSLVELKPETGRTHQLRIHMSSAGHPIVGDPYYSDGVTLLKGKGLFLCAASLRFAHPVTGERVEAEIEPPRKFRKFMEREEFRGSKK